MHLILPNNCTFVSSGILLMKPTYYILRAIIFSIAIGWSPLVSAQLNTDQIMRIGRNALYFEDYMLSIQYFNQVIGVKPFLAQPYFYRAIAKLNLEDYNGAEEDATRAIDRNPFITDAYEVRGVARQNLGRNEEAVGDYDKALSMLPGNRSILFNKALAQCDSKDYDGASATFEELLTAYPGFENAYLGRARLRLEKTDTVGAKADIDKALELDKNLLNGYLMRAELAIKQSEDYQSALEDMNEAIRLQPHTAGYFINRAFLRYSLDDYFGAMADYDYAIELDPANSIALSNRGMLRAEVHDYNKAVDDFSAVIKMNPDDYKTRYNRAILFREIGHYKEALEDLDRVIAAFPDFAAAYFLRFDIKRLKGDLRGGERDYNKSIALAKTRVQKHPLDERPPTSGSDNSTPELTEENSETQEAVAARFTSLATVTDNTTVVQEYNNRDIRGKVQDTNLSVEIEPMFVLSYYSSPSELKPGSDFMKEADEVNSTRLLRQPLLVTNRELTLNDEASIARHFESIEYYNSYIPTHQRRAIDYLGRAMDLMTVRNYPAALDDLDRAIALTPDFTIAYFVRAVVRHKKMIVDNSAETAEDTPAGGIGSPRRDRAGIAEARTGLHTQAAREAYAAINADLDSVIKLSPNMAIAYFNKGVILLEMQDYTSALSAFNKAIELKPDFGEAYYNRGYVYFRLGNRKSGTADLSKAGELGIMPSYHLLKKMAR